LVRQRHVAVWLIPAAVTVNVRTDVPDAVQRDEESVRLEEHDRARELAHHDALTPDGSSDTANVAGCEEPESRVTFTAITALCLLESVNDPVEVENRQSGRGDSSTACAATRTADGPGFPT
jgi:hypothetical protein